MVQLLHELKIRAQGKHGTPLLSVIKNPVTDHLPPGCRKISLTYKADSCMRARDYLEKVGATNEPVVFVIGAIAHGSLNVPYSEESLAVSEYAMSAAGVCAKLADACEELWGVL